MKAVMYGSGNIGRGFIGALLSQSGYEVTFIDVIEPVVKALQDQRSYPLRYVSSNGYEDVLIQNVTAVNGNDIKAVSQVIADCDILATSVGVRALKFIVPNIASGLRKRWISGDSPLNILICENLMDANKVLDGMFKQQLTAAEYIKFKTSVGLVETSIGRMVPIQTDEMKEGEALRVCVEHYGYLPVDRAAFKGKIPEIQNMVPYDPFDFYIMRKLYVHNMGHATCAYLGNLLGLEYIWESIDVADIRLLVQNAMLESAQALSAKYGASLKDLQLHITNLLARFSNAALKDTCQRVGRDPARKLKFDDRLIGASRLAIEQNVVPVYITVGAAAGIYQYIEEADGITQSLNQANIILEEVCSLHIEDILTKLILHMYQVILQGTGIVDLRHEAEAVKAVVCSNVV